MHMHATFLSWYYDRKPKNISTAIKDNYCNNLVGLRFGSSTLKCVDTCTLSVPIFSTFYRALLLYNNKDLYQLLLSKVIL